MDNQPEIFPIVDEDGIVIGSATGRTDRLVDDIEMRMTVIE